nr:hypothetical protein CFP56_42345 [Quercus suber]
MIDVIDDSITTPDRFLKDSYGNFLVEVNPAFIAWKNREHAMFTFLNSTFSPTILALTVGQKSARGVCIILDTYSKILEELNALLNAEERVIKKKSTTVDSASMAMAKNFHSQGFQRGRGGRNHNQRGRRGARGNGHNSRGSNFGGSEYSSPN